MSCFHHKNTGAPSFTENRWRIPVVLTALGLLFLLIYGNTINAPFVFDDLFNITKNPHIRIRDLSLSSLAEILQTPGYRPVANFSFALNYYLHGYHPAGYHIVNWLIHLINGMLVYLLARQTLRLMKTDLPGASFLAAALWLASPVHIQSVTYIVQRMNAMATMFCLASLVLYIRARTIPSGNNREKATTSLLFIISAAAWLCALGTKQIAITLPVMIFLYEWFFIRDLEAGFVKKQAAILFAIAAAITAIAFIYLQADPLTTILSKYDTVPFSMKERLLTQPRVICHYLSLLLLPMPERLNIDHYVTVSSSLTNPPVTLAALGFLLLATTLAVVSARRNRLFSFAFLWFIITLSVESSVIALAMMFEHRTYMPSVFLYIAATAGLMRHVRPGWLATGVLTLLIAVSGFWTWQRNMAWTDEIPFWQDAIQKAPQSIRPYNNLGIALALKGRLEEGIAACRQSIALSPPIINTANAYNNIAQMYYDLNENEKALEYARRAIQIDPDLAEGHLNLGRALVADNRLDEAIFHLKTALKINAWLTPAYTILARACYRHTGDIDQATDLCRQALTIDPDTLSAEILLGTLLLHAGDLEQSLIHLQRGLEISPAHPRANLNAGIVYNRLKRPEQSINYLQRAVATMPDNAGARAELGSALAATNRLNEARTHFVRSLDLSPDNPTVLKKLARIMEEKQQWTEAVFYYRKALAVSPEDPICLNQLAVALAGVGKIDGAVAILEKLERLLPDAPTVSFNLACMYARQSQMDKSVMHLEKALDKGYNDWTTLKTDTDLETIRQTPFYKQLINTLKK